MRGDGDGWAFGPDGARHWGVHGAAGLLLRAPGDGAVPLVLLQHRAAWSHEGGTWSIPGGARDSHETTEQAAVREAAEESGLPAAAIRVRGELRTAGDPAHWTYTTVYADAARRLDTVANAESLELAWVPEDQVDHRPLHPGFAAAWPGLRTRPVHLIVDVANLLGVRPDGWWRDRRGATEKLLAGLATAAPRTTALPGGGFGWIDRITAVVEGTAGSAADPGGSGLTVVRAPGIGDDTVAALAERPGATHTTAVVTADRGLRARLPSGAAVLGPAAVRDWLD